MNILYSGSVWVKHIENNIKYCLLFIYSFDAKYLNIIGNAQYRRKAFVTRLFIQHESLRGLQSPHGKINPRWKVPGVGWTPSQPCNELQLGNGIFTGVNPNLQAYEHLHNNDG